VIFSLFDKKIKIYIIIKIVLYLFKRKMVKNKRNLTYQENLEITKNRLSWEEDKLTTTDIKFFDEEMHKYHKYFSELKKNPKLKEIMKDLDKYVDTLDN